MPLDAAHTWAVLVADAVARGHQVQLEVRGRCMWPALRPGDRLSIRSIDRSLRVGDVVVYRERERLFAHRVIELGDDAGEPFVRCRGDASEGIDAPIRVCALVGLADRLERRGRTLVIAQRPHVISHVLARLRSHVGRWRYQRGRMFAEHALTQLNTRRDLTRSTRDVDSN